MSVRKPYHIIMGGAQNNSDGTKAKKRYPGCPLHTAIYDSCMEHLTKPKTKRRDGKIVFNEEDSFSFRKSDILKKLTINDAPFDISLLQVEIFWDYVVRHIHEQNGLELIGVNELFFTDLKAKLVREQKHPTLTKETHEYDGKEEMKIANRAISRGAGRKTVGYTHFRAVAGALRVARIDLKRKLAKGMLESLKEAEKHGEKFGAITAPDLIAERGKQKLLEDKK